MISTLPALGVGLGFREPFRSDVLLHRDRIDFLEITADHYLDVPAGKLQELEMLADHFTLIPHGLSLSLGSAEGLDQGYRNQIVELVRRIDPPWWSEHVAFTRAGGIELGHLAPVPFSREAIDILAANIAEVQELLDVPLILENITYDFLFPGSELDEGTFLAELTERTGCGLLLDLTNLYTNAVNHGGDPIDLLGRLPLDRVVQLHFVGGHWEQGVLIDSHSQPAPPQVWELMDFVLARAPVRGAILERDENLPPLNRFWMNSSVHASWGGGTADGPRRHAADPDPDSHQPGDSRTASGRSRESQRGGGARAEEAIRAVMAIPPRQLRHYAEALVNKRCRAVGKCLPTTLRMLGTDRFRERFRVHAAETWPTGPARHRDDAIAFAEKIRRAPGPGWPDGVIDIAAYESAALQARDPTRRIVAVLCTLRPGRPDPCRRRRAERSRLAQATDHGGLDPALEGRAVKGASGFRSLSPVRFPANRPRG